MEAIMMTAPAPLPTLWARLPAGGWQVGFWVDAHGRKQLDVADSLGSLAYRLAGTRRAAPSVDAGWSRSVRSPDRDDQDWALAVGHAPAGLGHVVSFVRMTCETGRDRVTLPPGALSGFWLADDGLWVAAAAGTYTHVRLTTHSATLFRPLQTISG
jgi:hypothetical protein